MQKLILLIGLSILCSGFLQAQDAVFKQLNTAYEANQITLDQLILNKVNYMFNQGQLNMEYFEAPLTEIMCGTEIMAQYAAVKSQLLASTVSTIESYLAVQSGLSYYISPLGYFKLEYTTTGINAVPTADTNPANGIPDFVEKMAQYLDYAETKSAEAGYLSPVQEIKNASVKSDNYYNVSFGNIANWGYTTAEGAQIPEKTRIVLRNTFSAATVNDDPDGYAIGAMKTTCAHEYRHAVQYMYDRAWLGSYLWIELDANWMVEYTYDHINWVVKHWGTSHGVFAKPYQALDHDVLFYDKTGEIFGWAGSYDNFYWEDYLHQKYDLNSNSSADFMKRFWSSYFPNILNKPDVSGFMPHYNDVLSNYYNTNLITAFKEYMTWNFFTGYRAVKNAQNQVVYGYDDAASSGFPMVSLTAAHKQFPVNGPPAGSYLENYAANFIEIKNTGQPTVKITFEREAGSPLVALISVKTGVSVTTTEIPFNLTSNKGWATISMGEIAGLIIVNPTGMPDPFAEEKIQNTYTYSIETPGYISTQVKNTVDGVNAGGQLSVNNSPAIESFGYGSATIGSSSNVVKTLNETFTNWNNSGRTIKHHDWDGTNEQFKLSRTFTGNGDPRDAKFTDTKSGTFTGTVDGVEFTSIDVKDPWFVESNGSQLNAYRSLNSSYLGNIFLGQTPPIDGSAKPYYQVKTTQTKSVSGVTANFVGWNGVNVNSGNENLLERPVVFNSNNPAVQPSITAMYKAPLRTGQPNNAYSKNQRRFAVNSANQILVYESMGDIWVTTSTNSGTTWSAEKRLNVRQGNTKKPNNSSIYNLKYQFFSITTFCFFINYL